MFSNIDEAVSILTVPEPIIQNSAQTTMQPLDISSPSNLATPGLSLQKTLMQQETPATNITNNATLISLIGPHPYEAPAGFRWVPNGWKLEPTNTDFKTLLLNKIKPVTQKSNKKPTNLELRSKV